MEYLRQNENGGIMTLKWRNHFWIAIFSASFSPTGSKSTSLYCGSIFDSPSKRKNPANLTACGVSWSWQCDSNTRPADYEPDSRVKTKVKQACSVLLQRLNHQVGPVSRVPSHAYFPVWVRAWVNGGKRQNLIYFIFWAAVNKEKLFAGERGIWSCP